MDDVKLGSYKFSAEYQDIKVESPKLDFTKWRGCEGDYLEGYKDACEKERSSTDSQRDTHPFVSENERSR